jgi:hypothetical protein
MANRAIGNGAKSKQFVKDFKTGFKDGLTNVLNFGKDIIKKFGVTNAINMGAAAFGVPVPVGGMISSGVDITSNLLGGGKKKRDILKDPNKYDFKFGYD